MLPPALRTDFQSLQAWRSGVHEVLDLAARNHPGPVIVPMTLVDLGYFAEIIGRLRDDGHDVRHFALLADRATVLRRLNRRGFGFGLRAGGLGGQPARRLPSATARARIRRAHPH